MYVLLDFSCWFLVSNLLAVGSAAGTAAGLGPSWIMHAGGCTAAPLRGGPPRLGAGRSRQPAGTPRKGARA